MVRGVVVVSWWVEAGNKREKKKELMEVCTELIWIVSVGWPRQLRPMGAGGFQKPTSKTN